MDSVYCRYSTPLRRLFCLCISILCFFILPVSLVRADKQEQLVRVGYDVSGSYMRQTDDGEYRGYGIEYLYEISKYTDWKYIFVPYTSWADAVEAVHQGDIDILPTVLKSPEREGQMLFPTQKMGEVYVGVIVPQDDRQHFYGDFDFLQGARVGIRRNTVDSKAFLAWIQEQGIQCEPVVFENQGELLAALDDGTIQAAAMSYTGRARKYRSVVEFSPQSMYFAITPGRKDLLKQIDTAMKQISFMNPEFLMKITKKYMVGGANSLPVFSLDEEDYINSVGAVRVALLRDAPPFSYIGDNQEIAGILPDLFSKITEVSGLKFTFILVDSYADAFRAVREGRAEVIGSMANTVYFAMKNNLRLTTPYMYMSMVQISLKSSGEVKTIGLQSDSQLNLVQSGDTPGTHQFKIYDDMVRCLEALSQGEIDAVYCDPVTTLYLMNIYKSSDYKVTVIPNSSYDMAFGVCKNADPRLARILDKSINFVSTNSLDGLITRDRLPGNRSFGAVLEQIPGRYLLISVVVLVFLVLLLAYMSFSLLHKRGIEKRMADVRERNHKMQADLSAARKISEAKEDFFSHVSHDMRTPLNGIVGFTNLASQVGSAEQKNQYIEKIRLSSNLLLDLINDTLQLSKLERGKYPLIWEQVDSRELFANILTPIRAIAEEKGLHFTSEVDDLPACRIMVDRLNTQKIFLNILSNAVKFTPAGGSVTFTAHMEKVSDDSYLLKAVIADTGIGISEEFLPHIYEPFAQEHQSGTTKLSGTGMGLSIVRQLVDLMKGHIEVMSKHGEGTTFTVSLPFGVAAEGDEAVNGPAPEIQLNPDYAERLQGKKILVCEDNELNTEIIKTLLETQGMTVVCTENGRKGLERFRGLDYHEFDAILMDLRMPVMDGYEAVRRIRALDRDDAQTIPIMALTANAYEEDIQKCLQSGMNGHVAKPIDPQKLFSEMARWIK